MIRMYDPPLHEEKGSRRAGDSAPCPPPSAPPDATRKRRFPCVGRDPQQHHYRGPHLVAHNRLCVAGFYNEQMCSLMVIELRSHILRGDGLRLSETVRQRNRNVTWGYCDVVFQLGRSIPSLAHRNSHVRNCSGRISPEWYYPAPGNRPVSYWSACNPKV